jgi:hypothetical protein
MDILVHAWQWLQTTMGGIGVWITQLPWEQWFVSLGKLTIVEWAGFLASIAGVIAFVIGIPRLWSFQYTERYRVFVELYKINEHLMSRLRSNDVSTAKTHREALRDYIHANSFGFSKHDNTFIYGQWKKANTQANGLLSQMETGTKFGSIADIAELIEFRERLNTEIQKLRKAPINMSDV